MPRKRNHAKVIAIVASALAAFVALIVLGVALHNSGATTAQSGSAATRTPQASSLDDWLNAMCKPGSFFNGGHVLHNADGGSASCVSLKGNPILIGQYSSEYMARNDAAILHSGCSAIMATDSGYELFVAPVDRSGKSLEPLSRFGFTVTPNQ
jgi:hypothetical protein